ncbi:hypothetical protein SAY86_023538 [Trapa natans]|uniref:YTH domain-containing family protein n=1 Tax=Trapa natans TaxID=22666 RepID=A0AAN7M7V7_TRANT|nr:hypothetical protein SAY86_023538 [Trapa natans]
MESSDETDPKRSDEASSGVSTSAKGAASWEQKSKNPPFHRRGNQLNGPSLYFTDEAFHSSQGGSPIYHQGYSYVPYGTVGPELHHYTYSSPYYPYQDMGNGLYASSQVGASQGKQNSGSNSEYSPSKSNAYYRHQGMYLPLSVVDASTFSDHWPNREMSGSTTAISPPTGSIHSAPNLTASHTISPTGFNNYAVLFNQTYPNASLYGQYGNLSSSGTKPFGYDQMSFNSKPSEASKYKSRYVIENRDGLNELNRGPRVKAQNIHSDENNDAFSIILGKDEYNQEDFPDEYHDAKFFIIKSYSEDDVHKSIKYGIWASTATGNKKLDAAYREAQKNLTGCPVFLFFSVNTSGQFIGVAEMVGTVDFDHTVEYWQQDKWKGCFPVKWHLIKDVQNSSLRHVKLANNENKPVTNSRDAQEVEMEQGIQILKIFKDVQGKSSILDDFKFYEDREKKMLEKKTRQYTSRRLDKSFWDPSQSYQ